MGFICTVPSLRLVPTTAGTTSPRNCSSFLFTSIILYLPFNTESSLSTNCGALTATANDIYADNVIGRFRTLFQAYELLESGTMRPIDLMPKYLLTQTCACANI